MRASRIRCHCELACPECAQSRVDHSLCALVAIDLAAFVAAVWLCVAFPESIEPWARTASAGSATRAGAASAACE